MTNYKFDDLCGMEPVPVIITEGKYEGISYSYGTIKFDDDDGEMKLNFDYDIVEKLLHNNYYTKNTCKLIQ